MEKKNVLLPAKEALAEIERRMARLDLELALYEKAKREAAKVSKESNRRKMR